MNFRKRVAAELPQFQITPMIDVVFLLLCFFVTTAVFSQWEYEVDIVLPTSTSGKLPDRLPGEVIVNVNRAGAITVNSNVLTPDDLINRLARLARLFPGQPIVIRADRETDYQHVMTVVDACRQTDIWNISFATGEADAKP
ncbi:MAG: biopolymer transporter ExbD [Lentisphaerae bacterium]|nr:biopolymer transporter ExbD [Lentisphaerota bacterium]